MAFIKQEQKKIIALAIKEAFPKDRFSLSVKNCDSLYIKISKSALLVEYKELLGNEYKLNVFYFKDELKSYPDLVEYFANILNIIKANGYSCGYDYDLDCVVESFYIDINVCLK